MRNFWLFYSQGSCGCEGNIAASCSTFLILNIIFSLLEISDEDNSIAAMYQAVGELPQANRDTLAFLMVHLQRYIVMGRGVGTR